MRKRTEQPALEDFLRNYAANNKLVLWRFVAMRIRAPGRLTASERKLIAGLFDRLAAGEEPQHVFANRAGRPSVYQKHVLVTAVCRAMSPEPGRKVFEAVAKGHGYKSWRSVRNIYYALRNKIDIRLY